MKRTLTTTRRLANLIRIAGCIALMLAPFASAAEGPRALSDDERQGLEQRLLHLQQSMDKVRRLKVPPVHPQQQWADTAIFAKGLSWALRYDQEFTPADLKLMQQALDRGEQRLKAFDAGEPHWTSRTGKLALGYVSTVDSSVQPYGLIVPRNYDPAKPMRLDVVLHGSTRPVGMSELRFMAHLGQADEPNEKPPEQSYLELHPLGRVENCYRWAGETDVFEAIEDVCRRYNIDRNRMVLRGMSMGASGTWHLGLKRPDQFVALGPYCGYVDTHRFSETPLPTFVRVGALPEHQELGLHMLDSVDYAANAGIVPAVACMGDQDVFFQAHQIMGEAMAREGLTMVNLISRGTGHTIDPATHAEQLRQIGEFVQRGVERHPRNLRFVTWTLKYNRCHWLELLGLERHYARAEFAAKLNGNVLEIVEPKNITRFAIKLDEIPLRPTTLRIGTQERLLPESNGANSRVTIERRNREWSIVQDVEQTPSHGKRPGLQGPIDDAFTTPFVCVRGTGTAWNEHSQRYADAALKRFADEWHHYFRGELPVLDDSNVTDADLRTRNLILFGDPGSNRWMERALSELPISWTRESVQLGGQSYSAATHVPALIAPSPFAGSKDQYIVLNSGHTFRESELAKLNYLLFPRWGDWAVLKIDTPQRDAPSALEEVVRAGYFDENWR